MRSPEELPHRSPGLCRFASVLLLGASVACPCVPERAPEASRRDLDRFVGGIQVNEPDHAAWGSWLRTVGLNTVAATVYAKQGDWDSANLWYEDEEPAVVSELRAAKAHGLKVVLVLRVALDHAFSKNRFLWHGMIMPRTEADLDEWFRRYGRFVEKWAAIAQREKVDVLGIASEMSALTNTRPIERVPDLETYYLDVEKQDEYRRVVLSDPRGLSRGHLVAAGAGDFADVEAFLSARSEVWTEWARATAFQSSADPVAAINARRRSLARRWREVITRARGRFSGQLTYAANFDQYVAVDFWDALDLIGINAYFPLRHTLDYDSEVSLRLALEDGWRSALDGVVAFTAAAGLEHHRVLFTELGYTRRRGATAAPWASGPFEVLRLGDTTRLVVFADQPLDHRERAQAVHALAEVIDERFGARFAGALYWKLSTIADHVDEEPFVLSLDPTVEDPMLPALLRLGRSPPNADLP